MPSELGSLKTGVGLGSGIPIQELVESSIAQSFDVKREKISARELKVQAQITSLGTLKSKLSELQDSSKTLLSATNLISKKAEVRNNPLLANQAATYLGVTASSTAQAGTYNIIVDQLAKTDKYVSAVPYATNSTILGTGTINITTGYGQPEATTYQITVDDQNENNTLTGVCYLINNETAITGVSATIINSDDGFILSISSNKSGLASTLKIEVTNDNGSGLTQINTANLTNPIVAQDAKIHIDGALVTLKSNHAVDVIQGLTFDLYQETGLLANTLTVVNDSSKTADKIKDFVDKYNSVIDFMAKITKRKDDRRNIYEDTSDDKDSKAGDKKRDYTINEETGHGIFIGDITIQTLRSNLAKAVTTQVYQTQYAAMSQIGITSDSKTGKLNIDEEKLNEAINNAPDKIAKLFTFESTSSSFSSGVAVNFTSMLDNYVSTNGVVVTNSLNLSNSLQSIAIERLKLEEKAAQMQYDLTMRFSKLDQILAEQKNKEASISQALSSMRPKD
jgi:flagellar hook-associated protein 2